MFAKKRFFIRLITDTARTRGGAPIIKLQPDQQGQQFQKVLSPHSDDITPVDKQLNHRWPERRRFRNISLAVRRDIH